VRRSLFVESRGYSLGIKDQRQRRLDLMAKQIADGTLVIRQASDAEREQWRHERQEREQREQAKR
jgi:hypothetical protein